MLMYSWHILIKFLCFIVLLFLKCRLYVGKAIEDENQSVSGVTLPVFREISTWISGYLGQHGYLIATNRATNTVRFIFSRCSPNA
jgi:hypothetical protein